MHDGKNATRFMFAYKLDGTLSDESFYGAKNVQSGKFGDLIYVPAVSKVDEHTKLSGPSALRDLLTDIMNNVIKDGKAYAEFSKGVVAFSDAVKVEKTEDDRSLSGFESELNELLSPWETSFSLKFPPPSAAELVKSMINWELIDSFHGESQGIDHFGSGFQRHFIYSLIQLGSKFAGSKENKKSKDFVPSLSLLLFEEPEAFLHPPQQDILARNLMTMSSEGNWQVVCATHSSHFVSKNSGDIPSIIIVRRRDGEINKYQISATDWVNIVNSNQYINTIATKYTKMKQRLHQDDLKADMEAVKHFLWLNSDRSILFFANHVLLVEGPSEVAFINKLISDKRIRTPNTGVYILDCLGKYNLHRFMNLLIHLGIHHSVVCDDDGNANEHADINALISATADKVLTHKIAFIPKDLEHYLGIPSAGSDHRKPQHILFLHEQGRIDNKKVASFSKLIEKLLE